jgi:hypothetical protein
MKSIKLILAAIAAVAITGSAAYADDSDNGGPHYVLVMKYINGATIPLYHYVQPTLAVYSGQTSTDTTTATNTGGRVALEETNAPYSIQLNQNGHGQQLFLYRNNSPQYNCSR